MKTGDSGNDRGEVKTRDKNGVQSMTRDKDMGKDGEKSRLTEIDSTSGIRQPSGGRFTFLSVLMF